MTRRRGPALVYIDSAGRTHPVDTEAIPDPRERAICRALTDRADDLADHADADDKPKRRPIGFAP